MPRRFRSRRSACPAALDGSLGANRVRGAYKQIAADSDADALKVFLARYADTKTTFENYRKEVERLFLWACFSCRKPISSLTHEDLLAYDRFMADPQPADRWICHSRQRLSRAQPDWRPFQGPLSPASRRQAMVILNVMFGWLVSAGYLAGNPLSLVAAASAEGQAADYALSGSEPLDGGEAVHRPHATRVGTANECTTTATGGCSPCCISGGLRISEVGENTMGAFFCRRDRDGEERWWLEVVGKGEKTRLVPATSEMMTELARYRRECGLAPFPSPGEETPLVLADWKEQEVNDASRASQHRQDGVRESGRRAKAARARVRGSSRATLAGVCALASPYRRVAHG